MNRSKFSNLKYVIPKSEKYFVLKLLKTMKCSEYSIDGLMKFKERLFDISGEFTKTPLKNALGSVICG